VTETQCDLGLTALKLDEVLQLMSTDYPEKCHVKKKIQTKTFSFLIHFFLHFQQFNHVWQQKRRTLLSTNNNSTISSIVSTSISNQSSIPNNSLDNGDKNRVSVCYE